MSLEYGDVISLLQSRGIKISDGVRLMRHTSKEYRDMPLYFGTEAFSLYQSVQDHAYPIGSHVVGFYGDRPGHGLLVGIWRVDETMDSATAESLGLLANAAEGLGRIGKFYNRLTELDLLDDLFLRLEITWTGKERSWKRKLELGQLYLIRMLDACPIEPLLQPPALNRLTRATELAEDDEDRLSNSEVALKALESDLDFLGLPETTRAAIILARLGQGKFRDGVIARWKRCAVTKCDMLSALVASHVIPWRDASNEARIDPHNGLLLTPNLDKLFDRHLISFEPTGKILLSRSIGLANIRRLGLDPNMRLTKVDAELVPYLQVHMERFQQNETARSAFVAQPRCN
ncbi:hypothetical protein GCM10007242_05580 [Pigmentiphaga litoralis]|uniref:HNH endonuclease n=1 Tax=Pigmentiphaga litoralis TaxID=516702 RepID=UPI001672E6E6|nr:HNH endonuclease [Pigmentiphaga litoralis]GGX03388.1 hypothetical protein GCM10007242_05580 [Pigmentiphaga litoralis]